MHIASIGIDLGKTTFPLVALDEHGNIVIRKKFSRRQLLAYTANLPTSLVGMGSLLRGALQPACATCWLISGKSGSR